MRAKLESLFANPDELSEIDNLALLPELLGVENRVTTALRIYDPLKRSIRPACIRAVEFLEGSSAFGSGDSLIVRRAVDAFQARSERLAMDGRRYATLSQTADSWHEAIPALMKLAKTASAFSPELPTAAPKGMLAIAGGPGSGDPLGYPPAKAEPPEALSIDTTPKTTKPLPSDIDAAERTIPKIMEDIKPRDDGLVQMPASHLAKRIQDNGHTLAAAEWAIHQAGAEGRLILSVRFWGGVINLDSPPPEPLRPPSQSPTSRRVGFENLDAAATDALWAWRDELAKTGGNQEPTQVAKADGGRDETLEQLEAKDESGEQKATVNDRMKAELVANLEEAKGWTAQEWADRLECAKSTIAGCETWKSLSMFRLDAKARKKNDRQRRT